MKRPWIIQDWAGNCIGIEDFETFEDAWEYVYTELTDRLGLKEEDFEDYYAVLKSEVIRL